MYKNDKNLLPEENKESEDALKVEMEHLLAENKAIDVEASEALALLLQRMNEPVTSSYEKRKPSASSLKKIPFLARYIKDFGELSDEAMQLQSSLGSLDITPSVGVTDGLSFGAVTLAAIDFLLIPAIYFSAFIYNRKIPITLTNNARWIYAAVLLALTIIAILLPIVAPFIAIATAGLTLLLSSFLLGKAIYQRYQLSRELKNINTKIDAVEGKIQEIRSEVEALQAPVDSQTLHTLSPNISSLITEYEEQRESLLSLKELRSTTNLKITNLGFVQILDKSVAMSLASLAMTGIVLSFFFPPLGLALLAGTSIASITYVSGRILAPVCINLGRLLVNKLALVSAASEALDNGVEAKREEHLKQGTSTREILVKLVLTSHMEGNCNDPQVPPQPVADIYWKASTSPVNDPENEDPNSKMG